MPSAKSRAHLINPLRVSEFPLRQVGAPCFSRGKLDFSPAGTEHQHINAALAAGVLICDVSHVEPPTDLRPCVLPIYEMG
jgi:hypothetical protein